MIQFLIKKYRSFVLIIIFLVVVLGISSFRNLPKEAIPDIKLPYFLIISNYPGADASVVEKQVTEKIEDKLPSVENISTFKSISAPGVSIISVEFKRGTDKGTAYSDLKLAIDEVKSYLPEEVRDSIIIKKVEFKDLPVYSFAIVGDKYPSRLYDKIRFLEDDLKKITGVDRVVIFGKYVPQIEIHFDYSRLIKYNLHIPVLVKIIDDFVKNQSIGKKRLDGNLYTFQVLTYDDNGKSLIEKLKSLKKQIEDIPIINQDGKVLRIKDIAEVTISHPFYKKLSYVDGNFAITYLVYKSPGYDITDLTNRIKNYLRSKQDFFRKNNLKVVEVYSRTTIIKKTFDTFISNFWQTALIIFIVIFLFIGLKESVGVVLAFPLVYFLTFIFLNAIGYTFNSIVSFSLVLTLGIMVDNLIVIIEGFEDGLKKGLEKLDAIAYSIKTYWSSLFAGNLTTIAMFLPLNFMLSGKIGEFIKYLPTTVNATLIFSVLVSFIFLPVILSFLPIKVKLTEKKGSEGWRSNFLLKMIKKLLKYPKFVIFGFWILFLISLLVFIKFGKVDFLPPTDKNNIYVNIKYDTNINFWQNANYTSKIYRRIEEFFNKYYPGIVKHIEVTLGDRQTFSTLESAVYRNSFNPNLTKINIILIDSEKRTDDENVVKIYPKLNNFLQEKLKKDKALFKVVKELSAFIQKSGPSQGKDVSFFITLSGVSLGETKKLSILAEKVEKLIQDLKHIKGTYGWSSTIEYTNGKLKIIYDLDKLKQVNLTPSEVNLFLLGIYQNIKDIPNFMNYKGFGINISKIADLSKDIIPIKGYIDIIGSGLNFKNLIIPGTDIYLNSVIKKILLTSEVIWLYHDEGKLVVKLSAYKKPGITLGEITKQINKIVSKYSHIKLHYSSDIKDMKQSMKDLAKAFLVGILLMFAVLVFQFGNFRQAFIVFSGLPLLFIGAFWLLLITGIPFSFAAQLGIFGLIGVGVNNAILLVDRFNQLIVAGKGNNIDYLLMDVVSSRLKPVFLTTLTTILGLLTLAMKDELWGSLALSFMGGLLVGTLITLVYIPAMLKMMTRSCQKIDTRSCQKIGSEDCQKMITNNHRQS